MPHAYTPLTLLEQYRRIETELTVLQWTSQGTQRVTDDRPCEPVTVMPMSYQIN